MTRTFAPTPISGDTFSTASQVIEDLNLWLPPNLPLAYKTRQVSTAFLRMPPLTKDHKTLAGNLSKANAARRLPPPPVPGLLVNDATLAAASLLDEWTQGVSINWDPGEARSLLAPHLESPKKKEFNGTTRVLF